VDEEVRGRAKREDKPLKRKPSQMVLFKSGY